MTPKWKLLARHVGRPLIQSVACVMVMATTGLAQDVSRIDQLVQSYVPSGKFMGAVLIARASDVVFSKGYGSANLEWNVPNTSSTKFRLGSITKQFTATSILLLEERGKVKVDDPVKTYLPDARPRGIRSRSFIC